MNIPDRIKIGASWWTVKIQPVVEKNEKGESHTMGLCHHHKKEIIIGSKYPKDVQGETFIHELIHACCGFAGMQDKEKIDEEGIASRLAPILYTVLKENEL